MITLMFDMFLDLSRWYTRQMFYYTRLRSGWCERKVA